ncbi:MAG: transposase [Myxococcota bacterium]
MSRQPRLDYPGAWHHVMHRGARRAPIFLDDAHCVLWLETAADAVRRFGIEIHAWSLMPNHYHLLVRSPLGTLSRAMRHLNGVYTQRLNRLNEWDGPVFRGRFHSRLVEDEEYQRYLVAYIHLNPVRANLVRRPDEEAWTSHRQLVGLDTPSDWLSTGARDHLFGTGAQLQEFVRDVQVGKQPWPDDAELDFAFQIPARPVEQPPPPAPATGVSALKDTLKQVQRITGAKRADLKRAERGRGANPARRFAALMLMRVPGASSAEIGKELGMSAKQVENLRHRAQRDELPARLQAWRDAWDADLASTGDGK